jgi:adhesin transport system outer membrane protein
MSLTMGLSLVALTAAMVATGAVTTTAVAQGLRSVADAAPAADLAASDPTARAIAASDLVVYQGTLSPRTAVALAIARHPEIRGAEAQIARRQAEVALAKSDRLPTIQYGVGPGYGGSYGSGGNALALRGNVGIDQPVWDYGATRNRIAAAKDLEQSAVQMRLDTVEKVARATLSAYIDAAAAQERMDAAREAIVAMRRVADRIGQRARAGLADRSDINAAGIAVRRTEIEAESARTAADSAMSRLIQLIGVSPGGLASLEESYAVVAARDHGRPDFDEAPAIQAAVRALDAADAKEKVARAERLPGVGVGASRTFSTGNASANDSTWIGVTLRGTFSLGGAGRQRVAAARADREAAAQDLESKRLDARTNWLVANREEDGARQRLDDLKTVSETWATTRDLYWQEYILDKRSLTDVVNAEREIYSARTEQIGAVVDAANAAVAGLVVQGGLVALLQREPDRTASEAGRMAKLEPAGPPVPAARAELQRIAPAPEFLPAPVSPVLAGRSLPPPGPDKGPDKAMTPAENGAQQPPVAGQGFAEAFSTFPASAGDTAEPWSAPRVMASAGSPSVPAMPDPQTLHPEPARPTMAAPSRPDPTAADSVGVWRVQLGAFARPQGPAEAWAEVRRLPALAGREQSVIRTGALNRLLAGPFASRTAAQSACAALSALGRPCSVVAPDKGAAALVAVAPRSAVLPRPTAPGAEDRGLRGSLPAMPPPLAPPRPSASRVIPAAAHMPVRAPAAVAPASIRGAWRVQLGAFLQPQGPDEAWAKVRGNPALAGKARTVIRSGPLNRLLVGPFTSRAAADAACAALKASGQSACMAAAPDGKVG